MSGLPGIALNFVPKEYIPFVNKEETFSTKNSSNNNMSVTALIMNLINMTMWFGAIFYAFKCGGKFLDVLAACCCSMCYLAYRLARGCPDVVQQVVQQPVVAMS